MQTRIARNVVAGASKAEWHNCEACPLVLFVAGEGDPTDDLHPDVEATAARLLMPLQAVTAAELDAAAGRTTALAQAAVIMCSFTNPALGAVAAWAAAAGVGLHIHVTDTQIRSVLSNDSPVHFRLPEGVRSMSLASGFFRGGYQLYREPELRDLHFDLPLAWQTHYLSPNEGGSGNTTPLYVDFCFILLGWSALRDAARQDTPLTEAGMGAVGRLEVRELAPFEQEQPYPQVPVGDLDAVSAWGRGAMALPREQLERGVFQFQRHFAGGQQRSVEAISSGGGTRSINYAFEAVLARARAARPGVQLQLKLVTGNPHLAVERAQRRFLFDVVRVTKDGIVCLEGLRREIADPAVVMVYLQVGRSTSNIPVV
jgi:hypothetical protein